MFPASFDAHSRLAGYSLLVKLCWVICVSLWILLIRSGPAQFILLVFLLAVDSYGGLKLANIASAMRLFLPIFIIVFLLHLFYHPGEVLFRIWFLHATEIGLRAAIFNLVRFVNFIILALGFFRWTSPNELATGLASGFGLRETGFLRDMALVFFIAMRFMPVLAEERSLVRTAMIARGAEFKGMSGRRLKLEARLLLPLFSRVLRQTEDVATAITLKSHNGRYFSSEKQNLKLKDIVLITLLTIFTVALFLIW